MTTGGRLRLTRLLTTRSGLLLLMTSSLTLTPSRYCFSRFLKKRFSFSSVAFCF